MIEIKITGTTPLEALASVTAFGWHCMKNQEVHAAATHMLEVDESKVSKSDTALTAPHGSCGTRCIGSGKPTPAPVALVNPAPAPRGCCSGSWPPGDTPLVMRPPLRR